MKTIKENLTALGNTSTEVAASLAKANIKGARESAFRCPIAKYLIACGANIATVGFRYIITYDIVGQHTGEHTAATLAFALEFDRGLFSNLQE